MKILGYIPTSFSDWDGKLVSILFLGGCNYRCPFCQNYPLLVAENPPVVVDWETIAAQLRAKKQWIDGVVVSGGEPLLHPEVFGLCAAIKRLGFQVKLDTNGSMPYVLRRLCLEGLVDYVAMDIKTALDDRYFRACGGRIELGLVARSIRVLLDGQTDYEFRTTLVPGLVGRDEMSAIGKQVNGARKYALQQFVPGNARLESYRKKTPYDRHQVYELAAALRPRVKELVIRGKFEEN